MDRKSKIFAPVKKVAGVRRAFRPSTAQSDPVKTMVDSMKDEMSPTILNSCSYKCGNTIYSINSANVRSILTKNKKHVCLVVTGDVNEIDENEALKEMPEELGKTLREMANQQREAEGEDVEKNEEEKNEEAEENKNE